MQTNRITEPIPDLFLRHAQHLAGDAEVYYIALLKGVEWFVVFYPIDCRAEALRTLGRYASDLELNFTWGDAVMLSQKFAGAG